jgi:hypothetical protein
MATKPPHRVPKETAATPAEIAAAIEALTPAELARLKLYAKNRIWKLGPKADSRTEDDLLQIAVDDLLNDTRRWNKEKVGIADFLAGAMRSISSNWAKTYKKEDVPILETDLLKKNADGQLYSPVVEAKSDGRSDPEQHMLNEEKRNRDEQLIQQIEHIFRDDEEAQMLLTALDDGYDPPGIRDLWGWTQNEYNTTIRRIRRALQRTGLTIHGARGKSNVQ